MAEPFLGELKLVSWDLAPSGWAFCDGTLLSVNQNAALFALFGTKYGGDGQDFFALPDMRGRVPIHPGGGIALGGQGGEAVHALSESEMPAHSHAAQGSTNQSTASNPAGNIWATSSVNPYSSQATPGTYMAPAAITATGGGQPHENRQPYLAIRFIVCLMGTMPAAS